MPAPARSRVFLADAADRTNAVNRLLHEFDVSAFPGKTVVVKANFNSADPFPASTHPGTLDAIIRGIVAQKPSRVTLAERSGMGNTRRVLEKCGVLKMGSELGFAVRVLDELDSDGWAEVRKPGFHWRNGFRIPRLLRDADHVVATCCLKTHRFGGHFTLSLKNSVGLVAKRVPDVPHDFMQDLHASPHQRLMIAEINTAYQTDIVIMDASAGFSHGGPERGTLIKPGIMLASQDRVALDAAGVALLRAYGTTPEVMNGAIFGLEQIARAAELEVGIGSAEAIELVPLDPVAELLAAKIQRILDRDRSYRKPA
jgi:uncharacterized protein (DUF362 family)